MMYFDEIAQPALPGHARLDLRAVAKQQEAHIGMAAARDIGAGDDDMRRVIAAHGVQGDVDGLAQLRPLSSGARSPMPLLDFLFDLNNLPAFVKAGFHVYMVRTVVFAGLLILDISR